LVWKCGSGETNIWSLLATKSKFVNRFQCSDAEGDCGSGMFKHRGFDMVQLGILFGWKG
jgi:hypothetical protein